MFCVQTLEHGTHHHSFANKHKSPEFRKKINRGNIKSEIALCLSPSKGCCLRYIKISKWRFSPSTWPTNTEVGCNAENFVKVTPSGPGMGTIRLHATFTDL